MNSSRPFVDSAEVLPPVPWRAAWWPLRPFVQRVPGLHSLNQIYRKLSRPDITPEQFCREGLHLTGAQAQ